MASSKIPMKVNPPDVRTLTKVANMTTGQITEVVSNGAYYQGRAFTTTTPFSCYVYFSILEEGGGSMWVSCTEVGGSGANLKVTTDLIYVPKGVTIRMTGGFNDTTNSGVYRADPMQ